MKAASSEPTGSSRLNNKTGVVLRVENVTPSLLKPAARQLRKQTREHVKRIARSMDEFGCLVPIIVDSQMRIVAGHGRWEAAKLLEMSSVPIIRVEHLTEGQLRLFAIADNKLPEGVEWNQDELRIELAEIELLAPELDLSSSGFAIAEIDTMYGRHRTNELSEYDEPAPESESEPVNRLGDMWRLGRHVLGCGDARDVEFIARVLDGRQVRVLLSDPPWNLKIEGVVSGNGRKKHTDFVMAAGEMTKPAFTAFLTDFIGAAKGRRAMTEASDSSGLKPNRRPDGTMMKGHSANPRGRPTKSRNMLTIFNELRDEKIALKVDGKVQKMTRMEAWAINMWNKAIGCDAKASAMVLAILRASGQLDPSPTDDFLDDDSVAALQALIDRLPKSGLEGASE